MENQKIDQILEKKLSYIVACAVIFKLIVMAARVCQNPAVWIPDDAFYYLTLARNFGIYGRWTFDAVSPATGFHPLWAYLIIGQSITSTVWISVLLSCAAVFLLSRYFHVLPFLIILLGSEWFFVNAASAMEFSLVIALACAFIMAVGKGKTRLAMLFAALGTLARTDFLIFPVCLGIVEMIVDSRNKAFAYGTIGAAIGFVISGIHNFLIAGHPIQASVIMKAHWSSYFATDPNLSFPGQIFGLGSISLSILIALLLLHPDIWKYGKVYVLGSFLAVLTYLAIYSIALPRPWYGAVFFVPGMLLIDKVTTELKYWGRIALVCLIIAFTSYSLWIPLTPPYPHQAALANVDFTVKDDNGGNPIKISLFAFGNVGAFNAGILGYYHVGVINLDGLMNDEAIPYIQNGTLTQYIYRKKIRYIVDFDVMFRDEWRRKMGGYNDPYLLRKLTEIASIETQDNTFNKLVIWKVND